MTSEATGGQLTGLADTESVGEDRVRGGYSRHLWQPADMQMREWFIECATTLGLGVETDRNGNLWAWWGEPGDDAVVTGSHLDSVPGGGAFDGPLGVVSALEAIGRLRAAGIVPTRPVAILVLAEEEGSRFGVACLGSQLMAGAIAPDRVRALTDADGVTYADAARQAGFAVDHIGRDEQALARIGLFIELHVEQGRGLIELDQPVALASSILAHGRWTLTFRGQGNHAGATLMDDRNDPMLAAARAVLEVEQAALRFPGSRATVGRIQANPGGSNVIASSVTMSLDARADSNAETRALVADIAASVGASSFEENSWTPEVNFDSGLATRLKASLGEIPVLPSGAGHDARSLAHERPTAMIFVRNPTGISHAPEELAELADCIAGIDALERILRGLVA